MVDRPPQAAAPAPASRNSSADKTFAEPEPPTSEDFAVHDVESPVFGPPNLENEAVSYADIVEMIEHIVIATLPKRMSEKSMAAAAGIKTSELHRAFMTVRGVPTYTSLHALRLDMADRLLRENPSMSSEAVALQCGFGHYGVFHRNYRRKFGREPRDNRSSTLIETRSFTPGEPPGRRR
ncbi:MAG: helix-turn-helix domain-containing protein [Caulobacteraceae bacterium]